MAPSSGGRGCGFYLYLKRSLKLMNCALDDGTSLLGKEVDEDGQSCFGSRGKASVAFSSARDAQPWVAQQLRMLSIFIVRERDCQLLQYQKDFDVLERWGVPRTMVWSAVGAFGLWPGAPEGVSQKDSSGDSDFAVVAEVLPTKALHQPAAADLQVPPVTLACMLEDTFSEEFRYYAPQALPLLPPGLDLGDGLCAASADVAEPACENQEINKTRQRAKSLRGLTSEVECEQLFMKTRDWAKSLCGHLLDTLGLLSTTKTRERAKSDREDKSRLGSLEPPCPPASQCCRHGLNVQVQRLAGGQNFNVQGIFDGDGTRCPGAGCDRCQDCCPHDTALGFAAPSPLGFRSPPLGVPACSCAARLADAASGRLVIWEDNCEDPFPSWRDLPHSSLGFRLLPLGVCVCRSCSCGCDLGFATRSPLGFRPPPLGVPVCVRAARLDDAAPGRPVVWEDNCENPVPSGRDRPPSPLGFRPLPLGAPVCPGCSSGGDFMQGALSNSAVSREPVAQDSWHAHLPFSPLGFRPLLHAMPDFTCAAKKDGRLFLDASLPFAAQVDDVADQVTSCRCRCGADPGLGAVRGQAQSKDSSISCKAPSLERAASDVKCFRECFPIGPAAGSSGQGGAEAPRISQNVPGRSDRGCHTYLDAAAAVRACQALNPARTVQCAQSPLLEPCIFGHATLPVSSLSRHANGDQLSVCCPDLGAADVHATVSALTSTTSAQCAQSPTLELCDWSGAGSLGQARPKGSSISQDACDRPLSVCCPDLAAAGAPGACQALPSARTVPCALNPILEPCTVPLGVSKGQDKPKGSSISHVPHHRLLPFCRYAVGAAGDAVACQDPTPGLIPRDCAMPQVAVPGHTGPDGQAGAPLVPSGHGVPNAAPLQPQAAGFRIGGGNPLEGMMASLTEQLMPMITALIQKAVQEAIAKAMGDAATPPRVVLQETEPERRPKRHKPDPVSSNKRKNNELQRLPSLRAKGSGKESSVPPAPAAASESTKEAARGSDGAPQSNPARKGKGQGAPAPHDAEGWIQVRREAPSGPFQLRAQDWSAPIMSQDGIGAALDELKAGATLEAVVLTDPPGLKRVTTILKGTSKPYRVALVTLSKDGPQKIPGRIGEVLRFRQASITHVKSDPADARAPCFAGHKAEAVKVAPARTSVVYFKVPELYMTAEQFKHWKHNPSRAASTWAISHQVTLADSWGWVEEQPAGKQGRQLFGIARLMETELSSLVAVSGRGGVFVDVPRGKLPSTVQWLAQTKGEAPITYLERGLRMSAPYGLATQGGRIGARASRDPSQAVPRIWNFPHVPASWGQKEVMQVLEQSFKDVVLIQHRRTGAEYLYRFRATLKQGDLDLVPLSAIVEGEPGNSNEIVLWATVAPYKPKKTMQRPLRRTPMPYLEKEKSPLEPQTVRVQVPAEVDGEGKELSPAKHVAASHRQIPSGCDLVETPKDGSCLFHAVASGLHWLAGPKQTKYCHRDLRARCVEHLRKHASQYMQEWDGLGPGLQKLRETAASPADAFEEYLQLVASESAYASTVEIKALGRLFDTRIIVLPRDGNFSAMVFHAQQRKRTLLLWYTPRHVELLLPAKGSKEYPAEVFAATSGSVIDLRAGGDAASLCSGTVWTKSSSSTRSKASRARSARANTVWTVVKSSSKRAPTRAASRAGPASAVRSCRAAETVWSRSAPSSACGSHAAPAPWELDDDVPAAKLHHACRDLPQSALVTARRNRGRAFPDGVAKCRLCPFRRKFPDPVKAYQGFQRHFRTAHPGEEYGLAPPRLESCVRDLGEDVEAYWRCKFCKAGIAATDAEGIGNDTLLRFRREHKTAVHPRLSWDTWTKQTRLNPSATKWASKISVTRCNAHKARLLPVVCELAAQDFDAFSWPRQAGKDINTVDRYPLRMTPAWLCRKCKAPCQSVAEARKHREVKGRCPSRTAKARAWIRLRTLAANKKLHEKAPDSDRKRQGEAAFAAAEKALRAPTLEV